MVAPASALQQRGASGSVSRADFSGTGGEMFGKMFVGMLLSGITLGIYLPWFLAGFYRYIYSKITFGPTARGNVKLEFTGTGGQLFVTFLVGQLLTMITLGIYAPWFITNLIKFYADNSIATTEDGTKYQLKYDGTGGSLLVTFLVGGLLCGITLGIYMPWFMCKLEKAIFSQMRVSENGQSAGSFDFNGNGGDLFGQYLVGAILTGITFGIYFAWFQVRLNKFFMSHTKVTINGKNYSADYDATGGELFVVMLVGGLLMGVTFGIYYFWFIAKLLKFQMQHITVREV
jgi:uncharacterized membrane protein YjgN (DUF898 family)